MQGVQRAGPRASAVVGRHPSPTDRRTASMWPTTAWRTVIAAASRSASGGRGRRSTPAPAVQSEPALRGERRAWRPPGRRRGEPRTGEGPGEPANREPEDRRRLGRVGDGRHRSRSGPRRARVPDCVDRRASPDRVSGGKRRGERSATVSKTPPPFATARRGRPADHDAATFTSGMMGAPREPSVPEASGTGVSRRTSSTADARQAPTGARSPRPAAETAGGQPAPALCRRSAPRGPADGAPEAHGGEPAGGRREKASPQSKAPGS